MQDGFVRIAAGTPQVFLADTQKNARAIIEMMQTADARRAKLLVLPEMCLTGYSVGDLVLKDTLLRGALNALDELVPQTCDLAMQAGHISIRMKEADQRTRLLLAAVLIQLRTMEAQFSQYMKITVQEV